MTKGSSSEVKIMFRRLSLFISALIIHKLAGFEYAMFSLTAYIAVLLSYLEERSRPR
ncbi:hypothetical protein [Enterococcus sp. DIV1420a]|uniref:hypothetical protein n=1 Tax=Enterococcus sp. DIV1420a TaxID=2774672 RepID=UPI0036D49FAA